MPVDCRYREPDAVPHLLPAAEALWQDQVVEVTYRRWSPQPEQVTRRLDPLGLVLKAGVWYLVATGNGRPRTHRVSSIVQRPLPDRFTRPHGFDLATFWQENVEQYERVDSGEVVAVRLTPNGIKSLPGVVGPKAARAALGTLNQPTRTAGNGPFTALVPMSGTACRAP